VVPKRTYELGPFEVAFIPACIRSCCYGYAVPFDGEFSCENLDALAPRAYRCADIYGIRVSVAGTDLLSPGQREPDR